MTDRELLELAAKAADQPLNEVRMGDQVIGFMWNPLEDDGDAFRLLIKLGMGISICRSYTTVYADLPDADFIVDECARRAITRAAAEIGRSMP